MELTICPVELAKGEMSHTHLNQALEAIRKEGYVVLGNIVSHAHLDILRERMDEDSQTLIKAGQWGGAGRIKGHLQQAPPPFAPYVFSDIVANPFVIQVTHALLGEGLFNSFYNGNTNSPGSGTQPLHRDCGLLSPELKVAHPASSVVINIVPMNAAEENGSIELWPGSHLDTSRDRRIDAEAEEARRTISPPVRGNTKKGSVLIRDSRLWHRGVPNLSERPRHMISMIHNIHSPRHGTPLKFNKGCEAAFEHCGGLDANVEFRDEQLDYLGVKGRYERLSTILYLHHMWSSPSRHRVSGPGRGGGIPSHIAQDK